MPKATRRIGVLIPASDPVVEIDLPRYLPDGLSVHIARLDQAPGSKTAGFEVLMNMVESAGPAARRVAVVEPELILFACTSASFFKGYGWDLEIAARIEEAGGIPAITTSTAVVEALKALAARRVFMITPYGDKINRIEIQFLKDHGADVSDFKSFNCRHSRDICEVTPDRIRRLVLESRAAVEACDALLISCTALRAMEIIEDLEAEIGIPVVTSNAASIWLALRRLGVDGGSVAAGRIFRATSPEAGRGTA